MYFDNFILHMENVFPDELCDEAIRIFNKAQEHGLTVNRQQQDNVDKLKKDDRALFTDWTNAEHISITGEFNAIFWQSVYSVYREKYSILDSFPKHSNYSIKMQKTEPGEGYHMWHCENSDRGYQGRVLAYMWYLNDVEEGGETEFLYYSKRIKPTKGGCLLWPAGFTHTHRGNPPLSNTKYVMTGWIEM